VYWQRLGGVGLHPAQLSFWNGHGTMDMLRQHSDCSFLDHLLLAIITVHDHRETASGKFQEEWKKRVSFRSFSQ